MPRPRPPPTPTNSTDLQALEKTITSSETELMFALPPPALRSSETDIQLNRSKSSPRGTSFGVAVPQNTPPISPKDNALYSSPRHKRTASGVIKYSKEPVNILSSCELPPPPSRARKIIQMKPKPLTTAKSSSADYHPPASAAAAHTSSSKQTAASTKSKQKQSSATNAAGRKIARKTAHSIIERRRRCKMNEEFGVLKDMIPACEGVEMHKLAILQAGIEYVRYLEGCVAQLKTENEKKGEFESSRTKLYEQSEYVDENEEVEEIPDKIGEQVSPPASPVVRQGYNHSTVTTNESSLRDSATYSNASPSSWSYSSPQLQSQSQSRENHSARSQNRPVVSHCKGSSTIPPVQLAAHSDATSATPTSTVLSPALNCTHSSSDLSRTQKASNVSMLAGSGALGCNAPSTSGSWTTVNQSSDPSPNIQSLPSPAVMHLPLPHPQPSLLAGSSLQLAHMNVSVQCDRSTQSKSPAVLSDVSATAEATAGAALMMLTNEWRGGGRGQNLERGNERMDQGWGHRDKTKAMSVRDLLTS
ncbi:hypothetical protein A1O1_06375 [Capronia coronata CBS 617.96]|uniref:BHLH domain-containing protein n=1 Tax=Capronia coronata CBS 617.96 TaxID=1182541 RepID=W9Y9T7_9EURO|nr:uncharacterized protein A1O1_06375 [Capronia coronata CBS 617.96]EXJ86006.1 hypothetical protein A1O1_06375 [Capronia coronata CBS 617.96]